MKGFWCQKIFSMNFDFKNECKNEFKDNNEKFSADPDAGFLTKWISKSFDPETAMPTA